MDNRELSSKEKEALEKFKVAINDILRERDTDRECTKWLRARNFDVKKAEAMYRKSMEWRKKVGADSLLDWEPPLVLQRYYGGGHCGFDKEGHPVWFDMLGSMDFKGMTLSVRKQDVMLYEARQLEGGRKAMEEQSMKLGKTIDQLTVIMDLDHLTMRQINATLINVFNDIMAMTEDNYPENLRRCFVINAPRIFPFLYNIVKPFLSKDTQEKVQVLGGNWKNRIQEYINTEQIPAHWGGTRTDLDGDPFCKSMICLAGPIPTEMYLRNKLDLSEANLTKFTIERGQHFQVGLDVTQIGSLIKWTFTTENYDIGFGILKSNDPKKDKIGNMASVLPIEKVNSNQIPQDGVYICEEPGTYMVTFDNRYSWVHSKQLQYNVELMLPEDRLSEDIQL